MTLPEPATLSEIIRVLRLIADPPNRRENPMQDDPQGSFAFWFDGGAAEQHTGGGTHYYFDDGTYAHQPYPWEPGYPDIFITFPGGKKVRLVHETG